MSQFCDPSRTDINRQRDDMAQNGRRHVDSGYLAEDARPEGDLLEGTGAFAQAYFVICAGGVVRPCIFGEELLRDAFKVVEVD